MSNVVSKIPYRSASPVLFAQAATAQPADPGGPNAPGAPAAEERAQSFRAVQGGNELQSGETLLVEAYAAIWIIVFGLILLSWRRQRQIDRRVDTLASAVDRARSQAGKGAS